MTVRDQVWTAQDTSPGEIEAALRQLLVEFHRENEGYWPARVRALAAASGSAQSAETIRQAFEQLMEIATSIAEPILWFYALTSLILMATGKSKTIGWNRLKNVGYAYIGMVLLPTLFAFLRWVAGLLKVAFQFTA